MGRSPVMMSSLKAFKNVQDQIGYCGIWCGSCVGGNGSVQELARKFEEIVINYKLEKYVPKEFDFKEFTRGLSSIQTMSLCPGCQKGGGPPKCKVKLCAREREITLCNQCNQLAECKNFEELEKSNPKIKEELLEIKGQNRQLLIQKWMSELKTKWPHCILLCTLSQK
jgi:hypothetical protein